MINDSGWRSSLHRSGFGQWGRGLFCSLIAFLGGIALTAASPNDDLFGEVVKRAKAAAAAPYQSSETALPEVLQALNYDTYRLITFRKNKSLWFDDRTRFKAQFFHPGYLYKQPVAINQVVDGKVEPVEFKPEYFRYHRLDPEELTGKKLGFAGFRLLYPLQHKDPIDEIIAFIGSSYFRALAMGQVYGISARGIAIDTAENLPEEFPAFREFWLCKPKAEAKEMEFFGLLDGPSVSGAYRFVIKPGKETMVNVEAQLSFRRKVQVLGLAPLTSMFWRGENDPRPPNDRRPEVHDSDGLVIEKKSGEEVWHPLHPVDRVTTDIFTEENPRGFGLLQRDRDPSHYRDSEAKYHRRPSVMVESLDDWGGGSVRLMQLPTANEYSDNVVAFWQPEKSPAAGEELTFRYRLRWFSGKSNKP